MFVFNSRNSGNKFPDRDRDPSSADIEPFIVSETWKKYSSTSSRVISEIGRVALILLLWNSYKHSRIRVVIRISTKIKSLALSHIYPIPQK